MFEQSVTCLYKSKGKEKNRSSLLVHSKKNRCTYRLFGNAVESMASTMNKSISDAPNKEEETYQLLEQLDHILKRPETYIGSNKPCHEV